MNTYFRYLSFFALLIFSVAAGRAGAQSISGSIGNGSVARGSSAHGVVTMSIPGGLHVNSNRPTSQYMIATTVRVSGSGIKTGSVGYPRGKDRKFQFSETAINVYEGTVHFPFSVNVPANFTGKTVKVRAVVHYQACTNEVCYPPKDKEITFSAKVL